MIDKLVGPQYSDIPNTPFYKIHSYNNTDLKVAVTLAPGWELEGGWFNIFSQRSLKYLLGSMIRRFDQ